MTNLFATQEAEDNPPPIGQQLTPEHFDAAEPYPNGVAMLRVAQEHGWSVKGMLAWGRLDRQATEELKRK